MRLRDILVRNTNEILLNLHIQLAEHFVGGGDEHIRELLGISRRKCAHGDSDVSGDQIEPGGNHVVPIFGKILGKHGHLQSSPEIDFRPGKNFLEIEASLDIRDGLGTVDVSVTTKELGDMAPALVIAEPPELLPNAACEGPRTANWNEVTYCLEAIKP